MPAWGGAAAGRGTAGGAAPLLEPLRRRPNRAALLFDFDGTLAAIVDDPADARPIAGVPELLRDLADRYHLVGVLSGRPVSFLEPLLPAGAGVTLAGLYGLESVRHGVRREHPQAERWRRIVGDAARHSVQRGPEGMVTETKGLSLTLHYRQHPELADAVRGWAQRQAAETGLVGRPARMSVELHPPLDADKGTALEELASGAEAVCFVGDDVGDLPAYDALDRLATRGVAAVRIAVRSDEGPTELVRRADIVLDGTDAVVSLLRSLLDTPAAS